MKCTGWCCLVTEVSFGEVAAEMAVFLDKQPHSLMKCGGHNEKTRRDY